MGYSTVTPIFDAAEYRIFFVILRAILAVIVLTKVSFKTTWEEIYTYDIALGGIPPIDTSLQNVSMWGPRASLAIWYSFPSILVDPKFVTSIPPHACRTSDCLSYFYPRGTGDRVNNSIWHPHAYPQANGIILNDAPGYQIEYGGLTSDSRGTLVCHTYGMSTFALQLCITKQEDEIVAGLYPTFHSHE